MRPSVANSTRITVILLLWTLLLFFAIIIDATTVSPSQDLASLNAPRLPAAALIEKRKHKNRHKSSVRQEQQQHADSEATRRRSHHHHHADKNLHPKSIFIRKGRIYIAGRPDWYNHYRRQRGPRNIMRKLTLESSHRRKATLTFPLMGGPPSGSDESAAADNDDDDNNGGDELGTGSKATEDQSGIKDKPVEREEDGGDGKEEEAGSEDGHEDEEGSRGSQSIQAVKKPQFVGVPTPVSVRHSGIIPKESSCGRFEGHGRLQAWMVALVVGVVLAVVN